MVDSKQTRFQIWLSQPTFQAGSKLRGHVLLDMCRVPADSLTLSFNGYDEISIWKRHVNEQKRYFKREVKQNQFTNVNLSIANFPT